MPTDNTLPLGGPYLGVLVQEAWGTGNTRPRMVIGPGGSQVLQSQGRGWGGVLRVMEEECGCRRPTARVHTPSQLLIHSSATQGKLLTPLFPHLLMELVTHCCSYVLLDVKLPRHFPGGWGSAVKVADLGVWQVGKLAVGFGPFPPAAWASSQHGGWEPRANVPTGQS